MFTQITLHMVNEKNYNEAMELLKVNTQIAKKVKGFVSRQVYFDVNNPLKGYSLTSWETREDLEAFRGNPDRPALSIEGPDDSVYLITDNDRLLLFPYTDSGVFEIVDQS